MRWLRATNSRGVKFLRTPHQPLTHFLLAAHVAIPNNKLVSPPQFSTLYDLNQLHVA